MNVVHETIRGYPVGFGYFGEVDGKWMLFATDEDYYDYIRSEKNA